MLAVIEEEGMLDNARDARRVRARAALRALGSPLIKEVRGVGLMLAHRTRAGFRRARAACPRAARRAFWSDRLHEAGLLTVPARHATPSAGSRR